MAEKRTVKINTYWLCQLLGWGAMIFVETINYTFFIVGKFNPGVLYMFTIYALIGLGLTHLYKRWISKQKIFSRTMSYIWIIALVSTLAISILMTLFGEIAWPFFTGDKWEFSGFMTLAGTTMNWARYVGVWIIIYFMYQILQQNIRIRNEKISFETLAKTTELELLKSQLNPHFLFNALNIIKALVAIDPEKSRDAIVKLSELLRFTLQYGKERYIPLKFELQEVSKYLELEQLRFGERLSVRIQVPDHLLNTPVPPAIVLTLAENAVKHGVARHIGNGYVSIQVMDDETSHCVIHIVNSGDYQPGPQSGIGLKHVTRRLDELYGGRAVFEIKQYLTEVQATLKLPLA
jgi:two-component system, LytTR family, sensor kinase